MVALLVGGECARLGLLAHDLDDERTPARTGIALDQDDLLPGPNDQPLPLEGERERGPQQRRTYVTRPIVIPPARVMRIVAVARRQLFEHTIQIRDRPWLALDGRHRGGRPDDARRRDPAFAGPRLTGATAPKPSRSTR